MQPHVKIYLKYFDLGEQHLITCEICMKQGRVDGQGFDIHHIEGRGSDEIKNIMCLCRLCHISAHKGTFSKDELQLIHNYFMTGRRKSFVK